MSSFGAISSLKFKHHVSVEGKAFTVKVMSGYTESDQVFIVVQYFTARCRAVRKLDLVHNVVQIFASIDGRLQEVRLFVCCITDVGL